MSVEWPTFLESLKHIETGSFPTTETPDAASRSLDEKLRFNNSIDLKPKSAIIK